jgi:hypothetical protein
MEKKMTKCDCTNKRVCEILAECVRARVSFHPYYKTVFIDKLSIGDILKALKELRLITIKHKSYEKTNI